MTLSRLELGFESPWGRHYIKPPSAAFLLPSPAIPCLYWLPAYCTITHDCAKQ